MGLNAEIPSEIRNDLYYKLVTAGFGVTIFFSLVGNLLLFIVFYRNKRLRDLSTVLIVQMSVSNVLYTLIELVYVVIKSLRLTISMVGCKVFVYINGVSRASSSLFLLAVSIERSTAISSPALCYSVRKVPSIKTKLFVAVWIIALVIRLGVLFLACDPDNVSPGYRIAIVLVTYILPFFVEFSVYIAAYRKIRQGLRSPERSKHLLIFMQKSMNVFALIVVIFTICVMPTSIITIVEGFGYKDPISPLTRYLMDMIEAVPCATNIICYLAYSPKFRQEIKGLFLPLEQDQDDNCNRRSRPKSQGANSRQEDEEGRALRVATRRLDWMFGDDPSEIIVGVTSPDTPLGHLKDLSLAITLKMEGEIHTIPEVSDVDEVFGDPKCRPEPERERKVRSHAATWPRRGKLNFEMSKDEVPSATKDSTVDIRCDRSSILGDSTDTVTLGSERTFPEDDPGSSDRGLANQSEGKHVEAISSFFLFFKEVGTPCSYKYR